MSGRRLSEILVARGIRGLILSPLISRSRARVPIRWEDFSSVVIGLGYARPELHRVHHHHFLGMMTLLRALRRRGFRRIGFYSERTVNDRMFGAWPASFLTHHPLPAAQADSLLRLVRRPAREDFFAWLQQARPEAVIDPAQHCQDWLAELPAGQRPGHFTLNWRHSGGCQGLPEPPDPRGRPDRRRHLLHCLVCPRRHDLGWLRGRSRLLAGRRLHRHDGRGARQRAHRPGRQQGLPSALKDRLQRRRRHRPAGGRARPALGRRLLPLVMKMAGDAAARRPLTPSSAWRSAAR
jgi:hypothetical protein